MSKVLAINGSPRSDGNIDTMLRAAAEVLREEGVEVEIVSLAEREVRPCDACDACSGGNECPIEDDCGDILESMVAADGLLMGSPVYFGGVTAQLKALFDRSLVAYQEMRLRDKVGGALACGGGTHGGQELTVAQIVMYFMTHDIIVANAGDGAYGAMGVAGDKGEISEDEEGMASARSLARRMARLLAVLDR